MFKYEYRYIIASAPKMHSTIPVYAMTSCTHVHWVDLAKRDRSWIVTDPGRLERLIIELPNPR